MSVDDLGEDYGFSINAQIEKTVGAARILEYVQCALVELIEALQNDDKKSLSVLPETEYKHLLLERNNTNAPYLSSPRLHESVEAQVAKTPSAIALVCGNEQLTYETLTQRANQLAHFLVAERGVMSE